MRLLKIIFIIAIAGLLIGCSPYIHNIRIDKQDGDLSGIIHILEEEYPFTEHKEIDWHDFGEKLQSIYSGTKLEESEYLELRSLVYGIPDSRFNIFSNQDKELRKKETSGFLGFELAFSPPDNYIVARIDSQSEAWAKGLRPGFEIIGWNQKHISDAIGSYLLRWGFHPSTEESGKILCCHYLCRGEQGSSAEVFYINDQENSKGIRLKFTEYQDDFPSYTGIPGDEEKGNLDFRVLPGGIGYWRIDQFMPSSYSFFQKEVRDSLGGISGLIIDLRENPGGYDPVAVQIAGHFISEHRLYEESFILEDGEYHIFGSHLAEPAQAVFSKNIILLTGPMTMGVAEGFVNLLKEEENIRTLGSWNTAGSFSLPGGQLKLGNGIKLNYPIGGALDEHHSILLESGKWIKGIYPDVYIPPTKERIILLANGYDVLLEEARAHILR